MTQTYSHPIVRFLMRENPNPLAVLICAICKSALWSGATADQEGYLKMRKTRLGIVVLAAVLIVASIEKSSLTGGILGGIMALGYPIFSLALLGYKYRDEIKPTGGL